MRDQISVSRAHHVPRPAADQGLQLTLPPRRVCSSLEASIRPSVRSASSGFCEMQQNDRISCKCLVLTIPNRSVCQASNFSWRLRLEDAAKWKASNRATREHIDAGFVASDFAASPLISRPSPATAVRHGHSWAAPWCPFGSASRSHFCSPCQYQKSHKISIFVSFQAHLAPLARATNVSSADMILGGVLSTLP